MPRETMRYAIREGKRRHIGPTRKSLKALKERFGLKGRIYKLKKTFRF